MAITRGRAATIKKAGTTIAAIKIKSISWSGEVMDFTTDDDGGIVKLGGQAASQQLTITCSGLLSVETLKAIALTIATSKTLTDLSYVFGDGTNITGDFVMTTFNSGGDMKEGETFEATFVSSGSWTYDATP